jgi:hypothetical protein
MIILLTNVQLNGRTGTEIVVRDLALGLRDLGHTPLIYSPKRGVMFDELAQAGITIVSDLADLPLKPDIIHGHHHVETAQACLHFPDVPAIFVVHDRTSSFDHPPILDSIRRYVAVDENCLERLTGEPNIPAKAISIIPNAVDMRRFQPRRPLPERPKKVLVFSNYATYGNHYDTIAFACERHGLPLDVIGAGMGNALAEPEQALGDYDLVFAKARCAIEALATGCAVILCDFRGMGEMVTAAQVEQFQRWNFGARLLTRPLDITLLEAEIRRYDPDDAAAASTTIRQTASLTLALERYCALYMDVLEELPHRPIVRNTVYDDTQALLTHITRLNDEIHALQRGNASSDSLKLVPGKLALAIADAPASVLAGSSFSVRVDVRNQSAARLFTAPPNPFCLSYHWYHELGSASLIFEGKRTPLHSAILPYETATAFAVVQAPVKPGRYRLRVTFVQEGIRWFDEPPYACFDETLIQVDNATDAVL